MGLLLHGPPGTGKTSLVKVSKESITTALCSVAIAAAQAMFRNQSATLMTMLTELLSCQALAHYTDRNIISVPLSQISTNQQLQDIVFDQVFKVSSVRLHLQGTRHSEEAAQWCSALL